ETQLGKAPANVIPIDHPCVAQTLMVDAGVEGEKQPGLLCCAVGFPNSRGENVKLLRRRMNLDPFESEIGDVPDLLDEIIAGKIQRPKSKKAVLVFQLLGEPIIVALSFGGDLLGEGGKTDGAGDIAGVEVLKQLVERSFRLDGRGKDVGVMCQADASLVCHGLDFPRNRFYVIESWPRRQ